MKRFYSMFFILIISHTPHTHTHTHTRARARARARARTLKE